MLTDRTQAKKQDTFRSVRDSIDEFIGTVESVEEGKWGGKFGGEYVEIKCFDIEVLKAVEGVETPLEITFRVNTSNNEGTFWVDEFLLAADNAKVLIPTGIVGQRVQWRRAIKLHPRIKDKETGEIKDVTVSNFVIDKIVGETPKAAPQPAVDFIAEAVKIAIGKTEIEFRSAIALSPVFAGTPYLIMAKQGLLTQSLVTEGKITTQEVDGQITYIAK